jgi:hypothetical protein
MLVTSEGEWVFEGSAEFLAALGDPDPDYDSTLFAVKNLGFIKFEAHDHAIVEIELHPRNVELPALLAVQQQLVSTPFKLFRIKHFQDTWCSEITSSAEEAISRLSELCAPAFSPPASDRFFVEPQDWSSLSSQEESPLRFLFQKWRMSFGRFDPSVIAFAARHQLLSRLMVVGLKPRHTEPIFRFIGEGHTNWLPVDYLLGAIGEPMGTLPDRGYGAWVSEFYKHVAATGEPRYDYVTATMSIASKTYYTRYERLLLPWSTGSDETLVTLSSGHLRERGPTVVPSAESRSSVSRNSARSS